MHKSDLSQIKVFMGRGSFTKNDHVGHFFSSLVIREAVLSSMHTGTALE